MIWCLHGAVGMADDWLEFARAMRGAGHEVQAVDLWSHLDDGGCPFGEFADRLATLVAGCDPDPMLLGYSMGGRLALHVLLASPQVFRGGVIVSAHPGLQSEEDRILRMASDAHWAAHALTGEWGAFLELWNQQAILAGDIPGADRRLLEARRAAVARGFTEWSLGKQADLRPGLANLELPVLWLTGERDEKFTVLGREVARQSSSVQHEVLSDAGHRLPWEAPDRFADEVGRFLERL